MTMGASRRMIGRSVDRSETSGNGGRPPRKLEPIVRKEEIIRPIGRAQSVERIEEYNSLKEEKINAINNTKTGIMSIDSRSKKNVYCCNKGNCSIF